MNDRNWENWLTGRQGTLFGDMKRNLTKQTPINPPQNFSKKHKVTPSSNTVVDPSWQKERLENNIADVISLAIIGLGALGWFQGQQREVEWYWYFGIIVGAAWLVNWLLKSVFRIVLVLIRILLKITIYLAAIGVVIWLFMKLFG